MSMLPTSSSGRKPDPLASPFNTDINSTGDQVPPRRSYKALGTDTTAYHKPPSAFSWGRIVSWGAGILITIVLVVVLAVVLKNASSGTKPQAPSTPSAPSGPGPKVCEVPQSSGGGGLLGGLLKFSGESTPASESRAKSLNPQVIPPPTKEASHPNKKRILFRLYPQHDPVLQKTLAALKAKLGRRHLLAEDATPEELWSTVRNMDARNGYMPAQQLGLMLNGTAPRIASTVQNWYYSTYTRIYILICKSEPLGELAHDLLSKLPDGYLEFLSYASTISIAAQPQTVPKPNDPLFPFQWSLPKIGLVKSEGNNPPAWAVTQGSNDIVVAVMDSGVDYNHPDLKASMWVNAGEIPDNNIDDDGNGYVDDVHGFDFINQDPFPLDDEGHGTHCAGIIAAEASNKQGIVGVAPNVKIMALKVLDSQGAGSTANQLPALEYVLRMNAHITSNSYGGFDLPKGLNEVMGRLEQKGVLLVAAAGNERVDIDRQPSYPAASNFKNIISVAASDENDCIANFSNYGAKNVDLAAPGTRIYSTFPVDPSLPLNPDVSNGYAIMSGTSMATPHVAGAAALVLSKFAEAGEAIAGRAEDVKSVLLGSVAKVASFDGYVATSGRLDVAAAMQAAGRRRRQRRRSFF